jgi:hypothetical protein
MEAAMRTFTKAVVGAFALATAGMAAPTQADAAVVAGFGYRPGPAYYGRAYYNPCFRPYYAPYYCGYGPRAYRPAFRRYRYAYPRAYYRPRAYYYRRYYGWR